MLGSGQSAAEVYRDLLERSGAGGPRVDWITRSPRFFPMEYTKLTLEMTSPEYVDHFHGLGADRRDRLNREHASLYKGISAGLVNDIHELLYRRSVRGHPAGLLTTSTTQLYLAGTQAGLKPGDALYFVADAGGHVFARIASVKLLPADPARDPDRPDLTRLELIPLATSPVATGTLILVTTR